MPVSLLTVIRLLANGMLTSLLIFSVTLVVSLPLGWLVCFGRMSKNKVVSAVFRFYISVMRGTPLMLQLVIVFFCPYYLFGIQLNRFGEHYRIISVLIGFSLNYAAYFAEIYRSGIESMPQGQYEAAHVLGYSRPQTFFHIILPQVIRRILPTVTNEVITLTKDTSLAYTLSVVEMFTVAEQISASQSNILPLFIAGAFYYLFNFAIAVGLERLEKRLSYYAIR